MTRTVVAIALLLGVAGCSNSRPKDVATAPGDCYCELSDLRVTNVNGELHFKVRYVFPDGMPKHEAWYACTFELHGANTSSVTVRKTGSELKKQGDFEATTNAAFIRSANGSLSIQMKQGEKKTGPFRPVSAPFISTFG